MTDKQWHLVVVEDDPDGQLVVATILNHLDLSIDVANNAAEAEQLLFHSNRVYDAAIIDLALPDKDGWELLSEIQASSARAAMPCIAVTAYHTSKLRLDAMKAGFTAYFPKPIDAGTFARRLEEML